MKSLIYYYKNLPRSWYKETSNDYKISDERFNDIVYKLKNLPEKPISLYIQNGCSIFLNEIFEFYNIKGIDFAKYFNSKFENQSEPFTIPEADIVVIYNIGIESALNTAYSAKLLYGLIEQIKQNDSHIFLCSHLSPSKFEHQYGIDLVNKIVVTKHKEESFI